MHAAINPELLRSPDWLLAGFEIDPGVPGQGRYHFAQVTRQTYHDSSFLDHRIQPMPTAKVTMSGDQVDEILAPLPGKGSAWVFHTGFCCSTLLASCLDHPGRTLVLREPLVLSRLAHVQRNMTDAGSETLQAGSRRVIGLCERSYPAETVLVKPSNFANRLMDELFPYGRHQLHRKAVLMTSSLESLLVSILKKQAEAETSLPAFVRSLLQDSDYVAQSGLADTSQLDLLQLSVVFWHCQRYFLQQRLEQADDGVFLPLGMERFLAEPERVLLEVSRFLGLGLPPDAIRQTVESGAFRRHSKQAGQAYDAEIQRQEMLATRARHAHELKAAMAWARPLLQRLPIVPFDGE